MSQSFCNLTSSDEPDFFYINQVQKHILNQLILTALKNWEAHQIWYGKYHCSAIKIYSPFCFIFMPWKKVKSPTYNTDYVQNICNKTTPKQEGSASCTVQKNN